MAEKKPAPKPDVADVLAGHLLSIQELAGINGLKNQVAAVLQAANACDTNEIPTLFAELCATGTRVRKAVQSTNREALDEHMMALYSEAGIAMTRILHDKCACNIRNMK